MTAFLAGTEWADANLAALAGDASARRYVRLTRPNGETAVLMDAPPDTCGSQTAFLRVASHLRTVGLAAPDLISADAEAGFLLMEDFGDRSFAKEAGRSSTSESDLYALACDVLLHLNHAPPAWLDRPSADTLADMTMIAFSHYAGLSPQEDGPKRFLAAFKDALVPVTSSPPVLVLRDYHAENLIWRPEQTGLAQAGLLDFQDALSGPAVYDLVSLLQDARRDLQDGLEEGMIERYIVRSGVDPTAFRHDYHVIGVQRHLRILGVFARLSLEMKKPNYVDFIPRTWRHLQRALDHPGLDHIAQMLSDLLPEPTASHLSTLRAKADG